ncbi:hypothetical protein, partial [Vibrio cholerae]|uniref:hypothetical protein n=1 Tax=Vibrio cholerae TaxID=666 RepID=UPI001E4A9BF2
FPTQVGVFLKTLMLAGWLFSLPHAGGGVSSNSITVTLSLPHAGWITEFYIGLIFELSVSRIWK